MENLLKYSEYIKINEGKVSKVEVFPNLVRYNGEEWRNYNYPKPYIGKGNYKWRVLARYGDEVKPVNFGTKKPKETKTLNKLTRDWWEALPYYK